MAHQAELTLAPALLAALPLAGRVVTGDALSCQRRLCQQIQAAGGDHLFVVKANQPTLLGEGALLVDQPPPGEGFAEAFTHGTHGSRHEVRRLWASDALTTYLATLGWPGVGQLLRLERVTVAHGVTTRQVRHLITSLPASVPARRLLALARGHWAIENRLHYVRDVTCGEDASTIRCGAAPQRPSRAPASGRLAQHGRGAALLRLVARQGASPPRSHWYLTIERPWRFALEH